MKYEKSCGAVIFKGDEVLLIKSVKGHWSFPKGHVEQGETEIETATREILEETNVEVLINESKRIVINYSPYPGVIKDVVYFYATYKSGNISRQLEEVSDIGWYKVNDALSKVTFETEIEVLKTMLKSDNN